MIKSFSRKTLHWLFVIIGFYFIFRSVDEWWYYDNPFTGLGITFWIIGFIILWSVANFAESAAVILPAIFLVITGILACIITPFVFFLFIWIFSAVNANGTFEEQAIVFFSAIAYLVLPGGALIMAYLDS